MSTVKVFATGPQSDSWFERVKSVADSEQIFHLERVEKIKFADIVMVFDHTVWNWLPIFVRGHLVKVLRGLRRPLLVLFRDEPRVVMPLNYGVYSSFYDHIHSPGTLAQDGRDFNAGWPVNPIGDFRSQIGFERSGVCMISADKLSLVKGELYTLRKQALRAIPDIDLYGRDWGASTRKRVVDLIKSFLLSLLTGLPKVSVAISWMRSDVRSLGEVEDKLSVMSRYKVAVVIENSATYVSEKLFDALAAGVVPVYVGPDIKNLEPLKHLVFPAEPTVDGIKAAIERASVIEGKKFRDEVSAFLDSDFYERMSPRRVTLEFLNDVKAKYTASRPPLR